MSKHRRPQPPWRRAVAPLLVGGLGAACVVGGVLLTGPDGPNLGTIPTGAAPGSTDLGGAQWRAAQALAAGRVPLDPAAATGVPAPTAVATSGSAAFRLVQLQVPTLHLAADVIDVGVSSGELTIPADPQVLGRWSGGAEPGQPYGSVVVAGHVDNQVERGALFKLRKLPLGAQIVAVGADGRRIVYRVVAVKQVAKTSLVSQLDPFRQDVQPRLVVLTCGGTFDPVNRNYADNVVVFAVPLSG